MTHLLEWLKSKTLKVPSAGEDIDGAKWQQPLWKTLSQFLTKLNTHLPSDPRTPLLGIYPREMKTYVQIKIYLQMFIDRRFVNNCPKSQNNPNIHHLIPGQKVVHP